jgi:hypothetical protein
VKALADINQTPDAIRAGLKALGLPASQIAQLMEEVLSGGIIPPMIIPDIPRLLGTIANGLLSYYSSYDEDAKVRDMLKDIAYDLNLALQKLDDIVAQIDKLGIAIAALPGIVHSESIIKLQSMEL